MVNALISATVVFAALLIAMRLPFIGGLLAMFPIKASAMLWNFETSDVVRGLFFGAIGSALFVAAFYFWPHWKWTPYAACVAWISIALLGGLTRQN